MVRLALLEGATTTLAGLGFGVLAARFLTRLLRSFLFNVSPTDPAVFALTAFVLISAALLASWWPARAAARIDPIESLRLE